MNLQIDQVDACTNTPVLLASAGVVSLTGREFSMSPQVRTAKLRVSTTMHDSVSGRDFVVSIALHYRRLSPAAEVCSVQVSPDEVTTFCLATAHGTVSDGATNFTPDPGTAVFQEHVPRVRTRQP
jgi:hypothetical protein